MRVLWTVNLLPTELAKSLNVPGTVFGGWVEAMGGEIAALEDVELAIACKTDIGRSIDVVTGGIRYFDLPYAKGANLEERCKDILKVFQPDLIHIEGTEFPHARVMLECGKAAGIPAIVSLQGILNGQYQYQCGQLPLEDLVFSRSLTSMFTALVLFLRKRFWYKPRMAVERKTLLLAEGFLGRTTWDRAHSYAINPRAKYYHCPRVLRQPFYEKNWELGKVERHSIYVGNGYFALKGLHFMLRALPQLIREYPDVKLYVAGYPPCPEGDKRAFFKKGYALYLEKLLKDLKLREYVEFTGPLSAEQVAERLVRTHVYVLDSSIENSPNTLGEAMMIGTPCVAAYVGGVPDMAADGKEALFYRNSEPELLAWNVKRIFDDDELARQLSANARKHAAVTHSPGENVKYLQKAYREILECGGLPPL